MAKMFQNTALLSLRNLTKEISVLTLTNPAKRNPVSSSFIKEFSLAFTYLHQQNLTQNSPKVLILNAQGPVFSSGHDLKEIKQILQTNKENPSEPKYSFEKLAKIGVAMQKSSLITISEVNGLATAAGLQLALSCDMTIASKKNKFALPGVFIGLSCITPSVPLYKKCYNQKKVLEMLLTGDAIDSNTALELGIINKIAKEDNPEEDSQVFTETRELAEKIAEKSMMAIQYGKKGFYDHAEEPNLEKCYIDACKTMQENLYSEDSFEGISAFFEKRKPQWKDK